MKRAALALTLITCLPVHAEAGIIKPLALKVESLKRSCSGTKVISGYRHTLIAGTRRMSLHAQGKAVDVRGNYRCLYRNLKGWRGGYSTDAGRMRHIHISYDPQGGREMGIRFRHFSYRVASR